MTRDVDIIAPTVSATMNVPRDRVRWGPIIAGLFATLCTLVVLSVLGIAVGATAYDPGDPARTFGIGAGIWAAISALIAFFVGGWLAARSIALRGGGNGTLNGAMVWVTAIPVMLFLLGGGLFSTAQTAAQAGSNAVDQISQQVTGGEAGDVGEAQTASATVTADAQPAAAGTDGQSTAQVQVSPQTQERAADITARTAWGVLVSMVLGLTAAAVGGYTGARRDHRHDRDDDHDRRTAVPSA